MDCTAGMVKLRSSYGLYAQIANVVTGFEQHVELRSDFVAHEVYGTVSCVPH